MKRLFAIIRILALAVVMTGAGFMAAKPAHAVLLTGEFVFIGPDEGTGIFALKNMVDERRAFRLFWREVVMTPQGKRQMLDSVEEVAAYPAVKPASPYLYAAPRRMMVEPGKVQNIRFMVRRTKDMAEGEYRSYIEIKPEEIPGTFQGRDVDVSGGNPNLSIDFKMLSGVRLPVFFLHGNTTLDFRFENVRRILDEKGRIAISFTAVREGTRSALGNIDFRCQKADGRTKYMGRTSIKIFTELSSRDFTRFLRPDDVSECVSPVTVNFTPHLHDPDYDTKPIASAQVP